ncbi:MAG TPA: VWA domain-containing protein [Candidatus Binataceae bacterium]|nr:VWA domain-containing protein [Candidatus Binataceae bacterium]
MSNLGLAIVGVCLILGSCANNNAVVAQVKPPEPCQQLSAPQVANQADYRQLTISINSSGDVPAMLSHSDLRIPNGNQDISVQVFQQEAASVGILVDTSGSMEPKMIQAKMILTDLIDGLNPQDQAFLMTFSSRPFVLQAFTTDHTWLKRRVDSLHAFGQTSLLDSIILGLRAVKQGCYENKALFVITDGEDNVSVATHSVMMTAAKESKVPIITLWTGDSAVAGPHSARLYADLFPFVYKNQYFDVDPLQSLADASRGKAYVLSKPGDAAAKQIALAIANEIDNHYTVGFVAPADSKIEIELLNHPGSVLRLDDAPPDVTVVSANRPL